MSDKKKRFQKVTKWVAEKQSPQAPDIKQIKPEKEAELIHRFRDALAKKKGRTLVYETE